MQSSDKETERSRYNHRASGLLNEGAQGVLPLANRGAAAIPLELRAPYSHYERIIAEYLLASEKALEICAGTGLHTNALLSAGVGAVVCTDISESSLQVLTAAYGDGGGRLSTRVADMECLPFEDQSFDLVTSAGGLSYGDPTVVMKEIRRVLRPGGHFICVDSFNENPVYRVNRWLHYLRGARTRSTLLRMPDIRTIRLYEDNFDQVTVRYFGAIAWLSPVLKRLAGGEYAARLSDRVDDWLGVYRSAFKFVMVAQKPA